ncbi:MAG TPA: 50S ribosomal protein L20, partial [Kiritimatiellia bacterium]|nr:50S ribosomal protein L20 [Kiritimatiellia bacterium]
MPRITNAVASRKRRKRRLALAKGFSGSRSKLFRQATEAVDRAMALSYAHRKEKKRDFRGMWIVRLSAACKLNDISYSRFIEGLAKAGVELNRKMLSE